MKVRPVHTSASPPPGKTGRRSYRLTGAVVVAMAVLAALFLSACGGGSSSGGSTGGPSGSASSGVLGAEAATVSSDSKPKEGGVIHYAHEQETPCLTGGWVQEAYLERQFADSLVSQTKTGKIVPWLATSWKTSPDHLVWTFKIKPGVKFTNGEPLDAAAIANDFEGWLNPETLNPTVAVYIGEYFKSAKALNPTTFQLTLSKPYAPLLSAISQAYFGILSPATFKGGTDALCTEPIGSGPWIVEKWTHGQNITFGRNPNYNSAPANALHQGPAYAEKLIWSFVSDPTTRYGSLTTGQSNVIYDVPAPSWTQAQESYEVQQYITPGKPFTLSLNTHRGPFTELPVREAFAYGADRKAAVESAFEGKVPYNGNGSLSQSTPMQDPSLEETWPYNPEKAEQLLDAAGWKKGQSGVREKGGEQLNIKINYASGGFVTQEGITFLQDLQAQWKEVGFNIELHPLTTSQWFSGEFSKPDKYDATLSYWTSPTPAVLLIGWRPWNGTPVPNPYNASFYNSNKLISLIDKGNASFDEAEQKKNYYAAQEIVTKEQVAVVGAYTMETSLAVEPNLHGVWIEASEGEPVFSDAYFGSEG